MRICLFVAIAAATPPTIAWSAEPIAPTLPGKSATKARDINGIALGMAMAEAAKRLKVEYVQGELVETSADGIAYTFGVCPSGRVYRIESSQPLGRFIVDKTFTDEIGAKLSAKFGKPEGAPDNLSWELVEPVRFTDGTVHPFRTNWASAIISGSGGDVVTLDLKMLDFRICWADGARANRKPRDDAAKKVTF